MDTVIPQLSIDEIEEPEGLAALFDVGQDATQMQISTTYIIIAMIHRP
jgi:hypothetical protein